MHTRIKSTTLALLASAVLAACGSGDGEPAAAPPEVSLDVPNEASASPEAFTAWTKTLRASESSEPYNMGGLVSAPSSETIEPASLN